MPYEEMNFSFFFSFLLPFVMFQASYPQRWVDEWMDNIGNRSFQHSLSNGPSMRNCTITFVSRCYCPVLAGIVIKPNFCSLNCVSPGNIKKF